MTAIVRVDPILEEFERVFGDVWTPWKPVLVTGGGGMELDVHETEDELVVKADLRHRFPLRPDQRSRTLDA